MTTKTIVLVHGALTGASVWRHVCATLQADGHEVIAPALPLRTLDGDIAYLRRFLETLPGPLVVAGHSYAGSVISAPDALTPAVRALVFVAAFQQDAGETAGELNGKFPGSLLGPGNLLFRDYPGGQEAYLRPEVFAPAYAADVEPAEARVLAAAQRPFDPTALSQRFDRPATWRTLPSWAVIATADRSIPTETQRWMAGRAGSAVTEVDASHAVPLSRPDVVAQAIAESTKDVTAPCSG
ncbi:alpha/beta fold hydrolase [Amycolatopsis sp. NBC_00438]|uniref:alpha/beta fold hydrolase n=1 Tax=Amycolatopsis sp. NBC_00438 TaxID=2903558 RepID=UPI002E1CCF37